jgi:hypothetical protein
MGSIWEDLPRLQEALNEWLFKKKPEAPPKRGIPHPLDQECPRGTHRMHGSEGKPIPYCRKSEPV